ncbi:MAG: hypothetical protein H6697_05300 [Myxococcales bacterium]|nr:hypothetical protein [Myxococcales bacterium]MCB9519348.1 hypothetical protein [Myxococcales bacterium]
MVGTEVDVEAVEVVDDGPRGTAVIFTAGLKGYTEPCGCTLDLVLGGIDRVVGTMGAIGALSEGAVYLDAGNLLFERPEIGDAERAQLLRKLDVVVAALHQAGLAATVPGPNDLANGLDFYRDTVARIGATIVAANVTDAAGQPLGPSHIERVVGSATLGVVGAVDPSLFADQTEVRAQPARAAIDVAAGAARAAGASSVVVLWHGNLASARAELADLAGVDFVVIGSEPRLTDAVAPIGGAVALEAYDQGRVLGWLKLVAGPPGDGASWTNARVGSADEAERLRRVISGIEAQIAAMGPFDRAEEPPIVGAQRARIQRLTAELEAMESSTPTFADGVATFSYRAVQMVPGLPAASAVTDEMRAYNRALRSINAATLTPPEPAAEGQPSYVGGAVCATCHPAATELWRTTHHASAWQTLVDREKDFDRSCVGCHVTGYERPGGSTLGHTDGLTDVQCEQCHGPGSAHASDPTGAAGGIGVAREVPATVCVGCHSPEHSPTFDYDAYRPRILGPGHGG